MLTDHLDCERRDVQQEQRHVEEVEERLDVRQRVGVLLQPRERHVDGACAHSDRELRAWQSAWYQRTIQQHNDHNTRTGPSRGLETHRLPAPSVYAAG